MKNLLVYLIFTAFFVCGIILLTAYLCYRRVFYSKPRIPLGEDEYNIPSGCGYDEFHDQMLEWTKIKRALPHKDLSVTSFDGLNLNAKYYEFRPGAPVELIFHGYRGTAERDLSGAIERCFSIGRSAILVEQRAAGTSDGHVISFGINECKDCLVWIDHVIKCFGQDVTIILAGISMGAATVIMASAEELPKNVKYVIADCSFTSPRDIITKTMREMKLPPRLVYPFVKLGAKLFGGFGLESNSPIAAVKKSRVPIFFIHGASDDFVPCHMSKTLYDECASPKKLVTVNGAAHGMAFPVNKSHYINSLREFEREVSIFNMEGIKK